VLRGSNDYRDTVCINPASSGGFAQWKGPNANMVVNGSISYRGDLIVVAVSKGSSWSMTLADAPVVRSPIAHAGDKATPRSDGPAASIG
jgi:hypothetical protein